MVFSCPSASSGLEISKRPPPLGPFCSRASSRSAAHTPLSIGLLASKTSATGIRGQYYGIAAAVGKIGAFIGTYIFPYIEAAGGGNKVAGAQYPFFVSSSLCILSAALVLFCLPHVGQDTVQLEDQRFRVYLESQGWDTRQLGQTAGGMDSFGSEQERGAQRKAEDVVGEEKTG